MRCQRAEVARRVELKYSDRPMIASTKAMSDTTHQNGLRDCRYSVVKT